MISDNVRLTDNSRICFCMLNNICVVATPRASSDGSTQRRFLDRFEDNVYARRFHFDAYILKKTTTVDVSNAMDMFSSKFTVRFYLSEGCHVDLKYKAIVPMSATVDYDVIFFPSPDFLEHPTISLVSVTYPVMAKKFALFRRCIRNYGSNALASSTDVLFLIQQALFKLTADHFARCFGHSQSNRWVYPRSIKRDFAFKF